MANIAKVARIIVLGLLVQVSVPTVVNSKPMNSTHGKEDSQEADFKIKSMKATQSARRNAELSPRGFSNFSRRLQDSNSFNDNKLGAKIGGQQRQVDPGKHKVTRMSSTNTITTTKKF